MKGRCFPTAILLISLIVCSEADKSPSNKLVKRQAPARPGGDRAFPLSRSRQFPPPEELEELEEYENSEDEEIPVSPFRGRQPPPDEYSEEQAFTEAPKLTTPAPQKPPARPNVFNSRVNVRPKFGSQFTTKSPSTTSTSKPSTASSSNPRFRATPAQSQRFDVIANILSKPAPPRPSPRSIAISRTSNENSNKNPSDDSADNSDQASRRSGSGSSRVRNRGRFRTRTSSSTSTTTTTTTQALPEEYYYYYEDEDEGPKNPPIATTTSTTTTTTTPRPALPKRPSFNNRRTSITRKSTPKPVKFDIESQFLPPPEDAVDVVPVTASTKRFTTSTTTEPPGGFGDIPVHLRHKYKPREDGRFIDFLRDPNRPRELKGFDLTDYPFYIKVPEDIIFDCDDKKDGYYASVPHKCQLFHYCFAGARYDFLCANYTLYDQTTFTCRFANNVDCPSSEKYYYRNDDLWKETTTTSAPETTTKKRKPRPRDYDYDEDEYDYEEYDEEDEAPGRRRRPRPRRRNRRKNKRKQADSEE